MALIFALLVVGFQNCESNHSDLPSKLSGLNIKDPKPALPAPKLPAIDVMSMYPSDDGFPDVFFDIQGEQNADNFEFEIVFAFPDSLDHETEVLFEILDENSHPICNPFKAETTSGRALLTHDCNIGDIKKFTTRLTLEGHLLDERIW